VVYRELKRLEDSGYSPRKIGYVLAKSVLEVRDSKYLSAVPTIEDKVNQGIPASRAINAEKNIKGHFLVCLGQQISILSENPKALKGQVPAKELADDLANMPRREDSVEYALFEGITGAKDAAMYLTEVGKRALEYLGNYHNMLVERRRQIEQEPKPRRKKGKKKGKATKRPNYMTNRQEMYKVLVKVFTG
jgi:hypothetical protein